MRSNLPPKKENYVAELNQQFSTFLGSGAKFLIYAYITLPVCASYFIPSSAPSLQLGTL